MKNRTGPQRTVKDRKGVIATLSASSIYLIDLSPKDMVTRLADALGVYVHAMNYPPGTENHRAPVWLDHIRQEGWKAVAAVDISTVDTPRITTSTTSIATSTATSKNLTAPTQNHTETQVDSPQRPSDEQLIQGSMLGIAYGYRGAPNQWWQQQVLRGLQGIAMPEDDINRLMGNYFELSELHIHPNAQGQGLGEALTRRLLSHIPEGNVLLSTPEISAEDNRAWRLYRRLGFSDVLRHHYFMGDPRPFAVLGHTLPL